MKFKNCKFDARIGPYSSVVERQSCKLKVRSSILREGISFNDVFFVFLPYFCNLILDSSVISISQIIPRKQKSNLSFKH